MDRPMGRGKRKKLICRPLDGSQLLAEWCAPCRRANASMHWPEVSDEVIVLGIHLTPMKVRNYAP
jgi:hypothetical protein